MNSFRIGMNSFRIKLSKGTILPFSFLLQLRLGNWKLCFLILSLHKKFYFLTLFTTPNSSIYPEWFHSGSEWIHSVLEWIHTVPEYIHSGATFLIVLYECLHKLSFLFNILPQEIPMLLDLYLAELREKLHRNECKNGMISFQNGMNSFQTGMKPFRIDTGIWGRE